MGLLRSPVKVCLSGFLVSSMAIGSLQPHRGSSQAGQASRPSTAPHAVHPRSHYDCNINSCYSGTYTLDASNDISGMQEKRYDQKPTTLDSGTNCGSPLNANANYVLQLINMWDSAGAYEEFGTGQQCSGSNYTEYWYAYDVDTSSTMHLLRTQGITGNNQHTFYLWQNSSYVWDAQIDSTNWKTFSNNSSLADQQSVELFSIANYPEAIAYGEDNLNIQYNHGGWTTYSGGAPSVQGTPDPMCNDEVDSTDWNVAEDPPNSWTTCT